MSRCPRCQTENPLGAKSCSSCAAPLLSWGSLVGDAQRSRPTVTLRVVRADGGPEFAFAIRRDEAYAGSSAEVLLVDDPFAAPRQARFNFQGADLMVEDVAGGSGVYVRIRAECRLKPGQELRCGRQRLKLESLARVGAAARQWGASDGGARLRLVQLLEGGVEGEAFPLREGENLLAREVGDITFPGDGFVSGRHALLTAEGEALRVRDLGSSNGTFVRLDERTAIEGGDQLLVGRHLIKVELLPAA